jgi:hypothetical protein
VRKVKLRDGSILDLFDERRLEAILPDVMNIEGLDEGQARALLTVLGYHKTTWTRVTLLTGPPGTGKTETVCTIVDTMLRNRSTILDLPSAHENPMKILIICKTNACVDDTAVKIAAKVKKNDYGMKITIARAGGGGDQSDAVLRGEREKWASDNGIEMLSLMNRGVSSSARNHETVLANGVEMFAERLKRLAPRNGEHALAEFEDDSMFSTEYLNAVKKLEELHAQRGLREGKKMADVSILVMTTSKANIINQTLRTVYKPHAVFVDEAAQEFYGIVFPSVMLPSAKMTVIIGDEGQIAPRAQTVPYEKITESIMKTLGRHPRVMKTTLSTQYRMLDPLYEILRLSPSYSHVVTSREFAPKEDSCKVSSAYLENEHETFPYTFWNCKGDETNDFVRQGSELIPDLEDQLRDEATSYINRNEARAIIMYAASLIANGYDYEKITILSPYTSQVDLIKSLAHDPSINLPICVSTVDQFQGKENHLIIVSLVRSNDNGRIGFLNQIGRLHVLLSRSRTRLLLFGNFKTFKEFADKDTVNESFWVHLCRLFKSMKRVIDFPDVTDETYFFSCEAYKDFSRTTVVPDSPLGNPDWGAEAPALLEHEKGALTSSETIHQDFAEESMDIIATDEKGSGATDDEDYAPKRETWTKSGSQASSKGTS